MTDVRGIVPPLLTPFDEDGSIAEQRLRDHVDFLIDAGVHGLFPGASIGELSNLNTDELERVTTLVVEQAAGEVPVYAGVGASGTLEAVERTKRADAAGADVLIAITPYFLETDQAGLYDHYTRIADATDLPILLYHLPSMTGQTLDVDTVSELATDVDTVVGLKDSSGDLTWGSRVVANTPDDFAYLQGLGSLLLPSLVLGADGGVTGTANVAPDPSSRCTTPTGTANSTGPARCRSRRSRRSRTRSWAGRSPPGSRRPLGWPAGTSACHDHRFRGSPRRNARRSATPWTRWVTSHRIDNGPPARRGTRSPFGRR
ncbi:dihydrodipicolinate synthase family protein [Haloplanus litoreus]|uniref:dihydrodipicolinate synthase family protein n=1 Tax=Haloplanus litoreus TaxID=767515 RepID=UPI00361B5049